MIKTRLGKVHIPPSVTSMLFVVEETPSTTYVVHIGEAEHHRELAERYGIRTTAVAGGGVLFINDDSVELSQLSLTYGGVPTWVLQPLEEELKFCFNRHAVVLNTFFNPKGKNRHRFALPG